MVEEERTVIFQCIGSAEVWLQKAKKNGGKVNL